MIRMKDEPIVTLKRVSIEAMNNAKSLLEDARILESGNKFGHAFALAVLAGEELSKAKMFWVASQQPAPAHLVGRELRVGEKILEPFRKHREKQILQFGVRWLTEQIQPIAKDVLVALENSPAGFEEAYIVLEKHVQEIQKDPAAVESFLKPLLEFAELQNERNRALYVDIQQKRLTSPSDFPAERCKEFIDSLTIGVSKAEDLLKLDPLGELFKEVLRLSAETLRRKDLQKFFTKRGGGAVLKQMRKEIKKLT